MYSVVRAKDTLLMCFLQIHHQVWWHIKACLRLCHIALERFHLPHQIFQLFVNVFILTKTMFVLRSIHINIDS